MGRGHRHRIALCGALAIVAVLPGTATANPGDLDPSFADMGKYSGGETAEAIDVQPDGKTLVLGRSILYRFNVDGSRDDAYGKKGNAKLGFPESYSGNHPSDVAALADGSSLIAGSVTTKDGAVSVSVVRHLTDGSIDTTFGDGGAATVLLTGEDTNGAGTRLAVQADGRIVVTGSVDGTPQLVRLTSTGAIDPTFNGGKPAAVAWAGASLSDIAVGADGRIALEGTFGPPAGPNPDIAIAVLNGDGTPNLAFSGDGVTTADLGGREEAGGVAFQSDGRVIAAAETRTDCKKYDCDTTAFALARFDLAGNMDSTFGDGGVAKALPPAGITAVVGGLAIEPDGKLVVAGGSNDFLVARFSADGDLDTTFGKQGLVWTPFRGVYEADGYALALAPDGKIVVAGDILLEEAYDELTIARYLPSAGGADMDADGVDDATDDCPHAFGTIATGCPFVARDIKLKAKKDAITGKIGGLKEKSGELLSGYRLGAPALCAGDAGGKAVLFEKRRGPDRKVATDRTPGDLKFKTSASGSMYVRIDETLVTAFEPDGPTELCGQVKSNSVHVGG